VLTNFQFVINLRQRMGSTRLEALSRAFHVRLLQYSCALLAISGWVLGFSESRLNAATPASFTQSQQEIPSALQATADDPVKSPPNLKTSEDWNRRLKELLDSNPSAPTAGREEYRVGPEDVIDINVFQAQELNREVRVAASGEISLPLLGAVRAAGLTPQGLEYVLQELLRRTYMKDPHVSVFVREMQSHPVSVMGAVKRPGVFQLRESKSLLEILSLAEGLADDAGDTVIILRDAGLNGSSDSAVERPVAIALSAAAAPNAGDKSAAASSRNDGNSPSENAIRVDLKDLLESTDTRHNPVVYPGDIVKVARAGIVYVVGEVRKPGGFALKSNEKISVLQAIALSEGLTRTAAMSDARIIRTDQQSGERKETMIDLSKIMKGKGQDPILEPKDIVFVPNSATKTTLSRGVEIAVQTLAGLLIFHW
jgi:polysaccharide export outer membrane protein